jgi:hypothetical protein
MGRPSSYTVELAEKICRAIAEGRPVNRVCREEYWCPSEYTVYNWLDKHPDFAKQYARAREQQQEVFAAEVISIADTEPDPARARNRMDARKWYASKVAPKKWGDRVEIDAKVETTGATSEALVAFLAALEAKKQ